MSSHNFCIGQPSSIAAGFGFPGGGEIRLYGIARSESQIAQAMTATGGQVSSCTPEVEVPSMSSSERNVLIGLMAAVCFLTLTLRQREVI